tara:strand:- start:126 stop:272 length:147 start_codon:yes stop_codon:yes gene_type:complete
MVPALLLQNKKSAQATPQFAGKDERFNRVLWDLFRLQSEASPVIELCW